MEGLVLYDVSEFCQFSHNVHRCQVHIKFKIFAVIAPVNFCRMSQREWENPKPWDPESKELENIWTVKNFLWLSLGSITAQGCDILPK